MTYSVSSTVCSYKAGILWQDLIRLYSPEKETVTTEKPSRLPILDKEWLGSKHFSFSCVVYKVQNDGLKTQSKLDCKKENITYLICLPGTLISKSEKENLSEKEKFKLLKKEGNVSYIEVPHKEASQNGVSEKFISTEGEVQLSYKKQKRSNGNTYYDSVEVTYTRKKIDWKKVGKDVGIGTLFFLLAVILSPVLIPVLFCVGLTLLIRGIVNSCSSAH